MDESSNVEGSKAGITMIGPDFEELEYSLRFQFLITNNNAKYETVITSLGLAVGLGMSLVEVCNDS